jgi:GntR family transcriptional regulator
VEGFIEASFIALKTSRQLVETQKDIKKGSVTMKIPREDPVPLYYRLAEIIKKKILNSEFAVGDTIPTEPELQKEYLVSRPTIRQAIELLIRQGFLVRERGNTPYVAQSKLAHPVGTISSFTEDMLARGITPSTRVISLCYKKPSKIISKYLGVPCNEEIVLLKRLRFADNEPILISSSYLPKKLVPNLVEKGLPRESLYQTLERDYGIPLFETDETVQAVIGEKEEAKLLNIPEKSPLLLVHRIVRDKDGVVVEYNSSVFRGDRFKYHKKLRGRKEDNNQG